MEDTTLLSPCLSNFTRAPDFWCNKFNLMLQLICPFFIFAKSSFAIIKINIKDSRIIHYCLNEVVALMTRLCVQIKKGFIWIKSRHQGHSIAR